MAVVEDIELRVTVDATGAQKGLDETRKAAETMGGRVGNLTEAFKNLQQKLGPSAAAISGVASALGQTNGEAGKALAAVGQVAAAFAAGGPFGAALAAGTFAVDQLTVAWEKELKAQDAAIEREYATVSKVFDDVRKLREQNAAIERSMLPPEWRQTADRKAALDAIDAEIKKTQERRQATRDQAEAVRTEVRALQERREELQRGFDLQDKAAARAKVDAEQQEFAAARRAEAEDKRRKATERWQEQQRKAAESWAAWNARMEQQRAQAEDERIEREGRRGAMSLALPMGEGGLMGPQFGSAAGQASEFNKQTQLAIALAEDWRTAWVMAGADVASSFGTAKDATVAALGVAVGGIQQLTDDLITGQEHAAERFAALIMQQAGQALISSGTKLAGEAVVSGLTPGLQPLAVAQGTAAAGLIASGIALGGGATVVTHMAAGGTIGQALPTQSTSGGGSDLGARARPARPGMGGPGGTNLTIVYGGLSGPSADDGARALGRGLERARRRGLAL